MKHLKKVILVGLFSALTSASPKASSAILFEGFYKITQGKAHTGFMIERKETVPSGNIKIARYFYRQGDGVVITDLEADSKFKPLTVYYSEKSGELNRTVRGTVSGGRFTGASSGVEMVGGKSQPLQMSYDFEVPSGVVLAELVPDYLKSATHSKFVKGAKFTVARFVNDPGFSVAEVRFGDGINRPGLPGIEMIETPKDVSDPQVTVLSFDGETLSRRNRDKIATLVGTLKEAVGSLPANMKEIESTFGTLPKGVGHAMAVLNKPQAASAKPK